MAISKLLVASIAMAIVIVGGRSDDLMKGEVDELRLKMSALESRIEDKILEIKTKEDIIAQLDTIIQEKLASIGSMESEIKFLQKNGGVDVKNLTAKINAWVGQIENQTMKLRNEIEAEYKKRDALSVRASEAEKKVHELNLKLETVLGAWLPPWLETHTSHIQDLVVTHWNEHAKPAMVLFLGKASEKSERVQKWSEHIFSLARAEWIPAANEQLLIFKYNVMPCLQKMTTKTFEVYEASKITIAAHIVKLQEVGRPYFQEAKKFSRPYIDQVISVTEPHVKKFLVLLPYTNHVVHACCKFLGTARTYHGQVQHHIYKKLKMHELTKPYATKELAWVMVSVLFAFHIFLLYRVLVVVFFKRAKKSRRSAYASRTHRRHMRRHVDGWDGSKNTSW